MPELEFEKKWRARFERFAQASTHAAIAGWSETGLSARVQFFKNHFRYFPNTYWLDLGCGAGTYCQILQDSHLFVVGIDYSLPTLKKAQRMVPVSFVRADASTIPLHNNSMDGLLCFGVLQVMHQELLLLDEATRILKKHGIIWIDGLNLLCPWHLAEYVYKKLFRKAEHLHFSNPWMIKNLLQNKEFTKIEMYWLILLPRFLRKFQKKLLTTKAQKILQKFYWITMWFSHAFYIHAVKDNHAK